MPQKVVLAYSGGLDTSVAIRWIKERYGAEVIALSIDLGEEKDYEGIRQKALKVGAVKAFVVDAKEEFLRGFVFPALAANALYEGAYPLATALGRPLIAQHATRVALEEGADAAAHGCTGKGNDQVRFEVTFAALAPQLKVIAPAREWSMTREQEIEYAQQHDIPVPVDVRNPYSVDVNLWGRSIECGVLEDPNVTPPEEVFKWTASTTAAPDQPEEVTIGFERGVPVSLDGQRLPPVELVTRLNALAGRHGVGRIDMVENRLVGIKSREVYEAPAATALLAAHRDLERLTLDRDTAHYKAALELKYAELVYYGLWHSPLRRHLDAFFGSTQERVTGSVRLRFYKGTCLVVGRESPESLYDFRLATYDAADRFDHAASVGFIKIWGLPTEVAAARERRDKESGSA